MTLRDEVGSGDRRRALEAMRDHLAAALEEADVNVKAQIAGQLRQVLADLEAVPGREVSTVDELSARRSARRAAAAGSQPS